MLVSLVVCQNDQDEVSTHLNIEDDLENGVEKSAKIGVDHDMEGGIDSSEEKDDGDDGILRVKESLAEQQYQKAVELRYLCSRFILIDALHWV